MSKRNNNKGKSNNNATNRGGSRGNYNNHKNNDYGKARDKYAEREAKTNMCNDPKWYVPTDQNIQDVASFSLNNILGTDYRLDSIYNKAYPGGSLAQLSGAPGIMSICLMPAVGVANKATDPVNLAATDIYNEIRRANSGTKVYDAVDCMQLIIALASVYSAISWAQRLYGLANVYSSANNYLPKDIIKANGVNADDLLNNMNTFRTRLNNLVLQANTFNVPKNIPIFERWYSMYSKVYADSITNKAQIYQYVPFGFYKYDDKSTSLKLSSLPDSPELTVDQVLTYITGLIEALVYSEDARTISADIEKAFGANGLYNMGMIDEAYSVIPDLSDELRMQIMNARIPLIVSGGMQNTVTASIDQDPTRQFLIANYTINLDETGLGNDGGWWLNTHSNTFTPEEVMVSTRLTPVIKETYDAQMPGWKGTVKSCGSEIPLFMAVSTNAKYLTGDSSTWSIKSVSKWNPWMYSFGTSMVQWSNKSFTTAIECLSVLSAFDWAPGVNFYYAFTNQDHLVAAGDTADKWLIFSNRFQDIDNGMFISSSDLDRLHTTALLGEFGIPNVRG